MPFFFAPEKPRIRHLFLLLPLAVFLYSSVICCAATRFKLSFILYKLRFSTFDLINSLKSKIKDDLLHFFMPKMCKKVVEWCSIKILSIIQATTHCPKPCWNVLNVLHNFGSAHVSPVELHGFTKFPLIWVALLVLFLPFNQSGFSRAIT